MADTQVASIVNEILRVESVEEAFSCFLVYKPEQESEKLASYQRRLSGVLATPNAELQESSVRQFLTLTAVLTNRYRTKQLLTLLENLVNSNVLQARLLCDCILANEKLTYDNADFWIECFNLIRRIIGGVDYKGVREIMKGCREKAGTLPVRLCSSSMPQLKALYAVLEYIFDRNASLLPAYFIVTEIHKDYPEKNSWPHWYFAKLFSRLVESFKPCAQMVSIVGHAHMRPVVEMSGLGEQPAGPWRLDPSTLRLPLRGNLPYDEELLRPQAALLRHVLRQPYSRDTLCAMLGLQKTHKQRCVALERQLVELLARPALEGGDSEDERWRWLHLSSQVIYLILIGFASFPNIVTGLRAELAGRDARRGRDRLMWVLLQFISGSIQRNPLANFLPIVGLHELLYPEREPLPVPDCTRATCTHRMAAVCIWMHLLRKAEAEHKAMPMPANLKLQYEFLQHLMTSGGATSLTGSDYRIALLCNAYSTNQELYARPMGVIIESLFGGGKPAGAGAPSTSAAGAAGAGAGTPAVPAPVGSPSPPPTAPLPMCALDSLTLHCKMSLIHSIVTHVAKLAQNKSSVMAPALLETYSRLLVYTEIESLGIKGFINQLLPNVFKAYAWGIFHNLLDMFSYRMHHVQPSYKLTLLSNIHSLAACPQANQTQLQLCFESTALRLIASLERAGVQLLLARAPTDQKPLVSPESEELNRALVLSLARGIHITGAGNDGAAVKELLATIMANTPHMWSQHTLQCFPPVLVEFFAQNPAPKENKQLLKKSVEEEYRKWTSMANDNDIIAHFSVQGTPLFLCLLWKMIFETNRINPIAFKILERIGARALSAHLRKFCDYLVFEVTNPAGGPHINKCVDAINDLVWKYNVVTIDRLVLCLVLRPNPEGNESQVCLYITQLLLLKGSELRNRAQDFVKDNSPDHWRQSNWHEKQLAFHRKYPEKFAADEAGGGAIPVHLSNVCLRFLPVLDLVVHRHLEIPQVSKNLEQLLDHLGYLYKFHDRPVTFLYNTLHYYEARLRDKPALKRRLAAAVLGPRAPLSERFRAYLAGDDAPIAPDPPYCVALLRRLLDCLHGQNPEPGTDWRFSEHGNAAAAALYAACAELLALPVAPAAVARALLRLPHDGLVAAPAADLRRWINALGLVLAALPPAYSAALHDHLHALLAADDMLRWEYDHTPFQLFDFNTTAAGMLENKFSVALALAHAVWYHSGAAQLLQLPQLVGVRLAGAVRSEAQLVFACQLAGGFLQRLHAELPRAAADLAAALYQLLAAVDHAQPHLQYMEPICDLFYHIKYMFVGDTLKSEVEAVVRTLRPALQMRLRFIAHLNVDHIGPA